MKKTVRVRQESLRIIWRHSGIQMIYKPSNLLLHLDSDGSGGGRRWLLTGHWLTLKCTGAPWWEGHSIWSIPCVCTFAAEKSHTDPSQVNPSARYHAKHLWNASSHLLREACEAKYLYCKQKPSEEHTVLFSVDLFNTVRCLTAFNG